MAQMTETLARDELKRIEVGDSPMFTRWEIEQLLRAWLDREALRKDAERYRWIRQSSAGTIRLDGNPGDFRWAAPQYVHWGTGIALDAAVDAAMAAERDSAAA